MKRLFGTMGAGGAALLLATANLVSYLAGFVRDLCLANVFGAASETDAFFAAFLIPDFLFNFLVLGFVAGALLPVFQSSEKQSKEHAAEVFHSFLTTIVISTTLLSMIAFALAPTLITLFFGSDSVKSPQELEQITHLTRILLLSPILFGISNSLGMILLARKRFFSMAISPVLYNLGIIVGIICFGKTIGIEAAVWGAVFGAALHLLSRLIDFPATHVGIRPIVIVSKELKKIFVLGIPKTLGLAAFQLVLITFAILSVKMQDGSLAAWNYARNIQSLPVSLFGIAFATAAFPFLSELAADNDHQNLVHRLRKSATQILFFTLPAAIGLAVIADVAIAALFEHGEFGETARQMTVAVLVGIAVSIPFESLTHLFARSLLAFQNTVYAALGKGLFFATAASSAVFLAEKIGVAAFGIAFSLGAAIEMIFLATIFHTRFCPLPLVQMISGVAKITLLAVATGGTAFAFLVASDALNEFGRLGGALALSIAVFFGGALLLKIPEVSEVFLFRRKNGEKNESAR